MEEDKKLENTPEDHLEEIISEKDARDTVNKEMEDFYSLQTSVAESASQIPGNEKIEIETEIKSLEQEARVAQKNFESHIKTDQNSKENGEAADKIEQLRSVLKYSEEEKSIVEEFETWDNKSEIEKQKDIEETSQAFKEKLQIQENENLSEKQEEFTDKIVQMEEFLQKLSKEGIDFESDSPEKVNECLKNISIQSRDFADWLRCEYLIKANGEGSKQELLDQGHFEILKSIEILEDIAARAEKGLAIGYENLSEEDKDKLSKDIGLLAAGALAALAVLGGIVGLSAKIAEFAILDAKGKMISGTMVGIGMAKWAGGGALASKLAPWALLLFLGRAISVERWEKITGVKAPGWLRKKEDKK